jgi:hypothetical protein
LEKVIPAKQKNEIKTSRSSAKKVEHIYAGCLSGPAFRKFKEELLADTGRYFWGSWRHVPLLPDPEKTTALILQNATKNAIKNADKRTLPAFYRSFPERFPAKSGTAVKLLFQPFFPH